MQRTDDDCIFCGASDTNSMLEPEVCDTQGGDYSHQYVMRCNKCGKLFLSYDTSSDNGRIWNWERTLDESSLIYYINQIAEIRKEKE